MLFFSFKLECDYTGEKTLAKAFEESNSQGRRRVADINDALCDEGDNERYIFISGGNPQIWQMAAAFSEKEKVSSQRVYELLKSVLKEKGGVQACSLSDLHEITSKDFDKVLKDTDDMFYFCRCQKTMHKLRLGNSVNDEYRLREEIQEINTLTKNSAITRAQELLCGQSFMDELTRIFSDENVRRFYGHPVHYRIVAGNQESAMNIVRLLVEALCSCGRLMSRRLAVISEITEQCYDESDLEDFFRLAAGTTVVIDLRGTNEKHSNYASAYEQVTEFFSDLIKQYHQNTLCIFIERTDNPGFTPSLMAKVEEHINVISISDGTGNRKESADYLLRLVKAADFEVMDKNEIKTALLEKTSFTTSELYGIYNRFYKDGLTNKLYRAYKTANHVTAERKESAGDAYKRLQEMVGLTEVKKIIDQIIATKKVLKMRSEVGLAKQQITLHMIFTGNPGSAKTSVARLLAEILKQADVLKSSAFVECGRSDLVGKFVGWTAPLVQRKFRQARGGVLFIDEAYSLVDEKNGMYGDEAINTIVQEMENHRDSVLVIFAGYKEKMEGLLEKNEGLRSRIAFHVDFPDYNADELTQILSLMAKERGYETDSRVLARCREIFQAACGEKDFGNGRFVRNLLEQAILKQSRRIVTGCGGKAITRKELSQLMPSDFDVNISNRYRNRRAGIGFM